MTNKPIQNINHPGIFTILAATFRGPNGVWMKFVFVMSLVMLGVCIWCINGLIEATDIKAMISYALGIMISTLVLAMYKLWTWLEMQKVALYIALKTTEKD